MIDALLLATILTPAMQTPAPAPSASVAPAPAAPWYLPGREQDGQVARIAFRLATAARARCPVTAPALGLVLQHLAQFQPADRAGMIVALALDKGPAAIVVVPGGPADRAGLRTGDILLAVGDNFLPPDRDVVAPFDAARAHARVDAVDDLLAAAGTRPFAVTLMRDGATMSVTLTATPACPSRVMLARSGQLNAFADGRHVFLTTGLVARTRTDDELAFVIAHEMAHNILGHAAIMRGDTVHRGLGRTLGRSGRIIRGVERDADALGGEMMIDAGFDPVAGAAILGRIDTDLGIALFASHDSAGKRIAAMRALVAARRAP